MSQISHTSPRVLPVRIPARLWLAIGLLIAGVAIAVVLATSDGHHAGSAPQASASHSKAAGVRYDGGPEEGTRGPLASSPAAHLRYDGGPERGTAGK